MKEDVGDSLGYGIKEGRGGKEDWRIQTLRITGFPSHLDVFRKVFYLMPNRAEDKEVIF